MGLGDNKISNEDVRSKSPAPSISLPKGGAAIRGIGEKFSTNPVTGTGSTTIPIATSPGRSGFNPGLSLTYDSGAGNGPFGFGWSLSLPQISRKTDKGLPCYLDTEESDVFILSGAEDLVPEFKKDAAGSWEVEGGEHVFIEQLRSVAGVNYRVRRYRPRIEGLFARIERWTKDGDPKDVHWRSISKENILTIYGKDDNSRIADPEDSNRIFTWLISETRDDKGNALVYMYKSEDGTGLDFSLAHEKNRGKSDDPRRTANRYLKKIRYGNRDPLLDKDGKRPLFVQDDTLKGADWMFEVVFDYGEHDTAIPKPDDSNPWVFRDDPFSSYRSGFEVRTCRICRRVLMFHHFEQEDGVGKNCLVRSTDFTYSHQQKPGDVCNPIYTFIMAVTQTGYRRNNSGYIKRSLPPVEFEYSRPAIENTIRDIDAGSLENLPAGLDNTAYQWTDLHGEGIPGILSEQGGTWYYKRNLSPINTTSVGGLPQTAAKFNPIEQVAIKPNLSLNDGAQFMDLAGDGQPDLVVMDGPMPGLYEHDGGEGWKPFRPFTSRLNRNTRDPNLQFIDLDGDGHTDVLITEDGTFMWHPSLAEQGFERARRTAQAMDEETGPCLVFADSTQTIFLADLSGDGLTDLVRIRNGEVCYWPNLGYARFGPKITMDNSPSFDHPDRFDPRSIRLADIDGSGTTDIIYLHSEGVCLYFNESGNSWSKSQRLNIYPQVDNLSSVTATDLLGNGTACLVWSSPLPGDAGRQMRYVNLMGNQKPHLLIKTINNLGAETRVRYAPSTRFYLQDKYDGKPWITKLPFPVHVVERVETYDYISRNRFVTRYAYHHGYFDGEEREFRGFGMVEQWDTEEIAALVPSDTLPAATNSDPAAHLPPVHSKTWFHTGVYMNRDLISRQYETEYYREPGLSDTEFQAQLLPDTTLPAGLSLDEEREACRALKGMMLRQEVYADDAPKNATQQELQRANTPYTVTEQDFTIRTLQPRGTNRHAVFFAHPREVISYHYERNSKDPRIQHALTLEVGKFGNILKEVAIGYGRCQKDNSLPTQADQNKQIQAGITYTENGVTNAIDDSSFPNDYHTPLPCETRTYELTGLKPEKKAPRFSFAEWTSDSFALLVSANEIPYEQTADGVSKQKRLIEQVRSLYRKDNLTTLLPLGQMEPLALPGEEYKLAFTPGLLTHVFQRDGQALLDPASVLDAEGGYVQSQQMKASGFPGTDLDNHWWIPAGRAFLSPNINDTVAQELTYAQNNFFLPLRYRDPFNNTSTVTYDTYNLLIVDTRDPLGNRVTAGERKLDGSLDSTKPGNDYRVLQAQRIMDPNRNRTEVAFDALGLVAGTAVMGKPEENMGDSLTGFNADLADSTISNHLSNPLSNPHAILGSASTRLVYDLFAYQRSTAEANPQPTVSCTLARETHVSDLEPGKATKIQHSFSYSDGFGREIQKKIQAKAGPVPKRDAEGKIIISPGGQPEMTTGNKSPRWVGSSWTIFNNKGKPVRQYEPFFTDTHRFEFGVQVGVSPILFYDPLERVIATLHPNHTYEKVRFDPWSQVTWDVNDTVLTDPRKDTDIAGYTAPFFASMPAGTASAWQTWHEQRKIGALGVQEKAAAAKASAHADTPATVYLDTLGRPFLTVTLNKVSCPNHALDGTEEKLYTRVELDIEGNERAVRDAMHDYSDAAGNSAVDELGRIVMRYDYDMLGNRIHQASMEAGQRWMLSDIAGNPIRAWDSLGHSFRTQHDPLRRPIRIYVTGADSNNPNRELLTERLVYGEQYPNAEQSNLRGVPCLHLDQAGAVNTLALDYKGNPLNTWRRIAAEYKQAISWETVDSVLPSGSTTLLDSTVLEAALRLLLENETYMSRTAYDALNRPIQLIAPHGNQSGAKLNVLQPGYNEANLLERMDVWLEQPMEPSSLIDTGVIPPSAVGVSNIDHDAKGQRLRIDYKNGATTIYNYDPLTFRLINLITRRSSAAFTGDNPQPPQTGWPGNQVQNLHYSYDPAGNITHIRDDAQQAIFFRNKRVEPSADYTYDAMYRLVQGTGREHLGQMGGTPIPHSHDDAPRVGLLHPGDGQVMGTYIERYLYDSAGNIMEMKHIGSDSSQGWTRTYAYTESSLIEDGTGGMKQKVSNRLSSTTTGNGITITQHYVHDAHGNMVRMPHLGGAHPTANMFWDYRDQLQKCDLGGGGTAYYTYDAAGQRLRKVWEKLPGLIEERIYLGGFEIFRKHGATVGANTATLERETLHLMDDKERIALVETRTLDTAGNDPAPRQLIRYQFGNHLGSASLELDAQAQIISHEEYSPFGITTYQAVRSQNETAKRYRYTRKERDEESSLYYYDARYYAAWLGRWLICDPIGVRDGLNLYAYVENNPISFSDPSGMQREYHGIGGWIHKNVYEPAQRDYAAWIQWGTSVGDRWGAKVPVVGHIGGALAGFAPTILGGAGQSFTSALQFVTPRTQEEHFLTVVSAGTATPAIRMGTALKAGLARIRGCLSRNRRGIQQAVREAESQLPRAAAQGEQGLVKETLPTTAAQPNSVAPPTTPAPTAQAAPAPVRPAPPSGAPARWRESTGASPRGAQFQSASAKTPRSIVTSVRPDVAESQAYMEALHRGEIGLQRPSGSNVPGADFITARIRPDGAVEVLVTDVKSSTVGRFPPPGTAVPPAWFAEVQAAVAPGRLNLNNPALEGQIQAAVQAGRVLPRQVNVNYSPSPQGQGRMTGF